MLCYEIFHDEKITPTSAKVASQQICAGGQNPLLHFYIFPQSFQQIRKQGRLVYRPVVKTTSTRYYVSEIMQGGKLYFLQFCDDEKMKVVTPRGHLVVGTIQARVCRQISKQKPGMTSGNCDVTQWNTRQTDRQNGRNYNQHHRVQTFSNFSSAVQAHDIWLS